MNILETEETALLKVEKLHILDFLVNGTMGLLRFLVRLMRRLESGMLEILGDAMTVPPRARGQGQDDGRTGILNENAYENVQLDM